MHSCEYLAFKVLCWRFSILAVTSIEFNYSTDVREPARFHLDEGATTIMLESQFQLELKQGMEQQAKISAVFLATAKVEVFAAKVVSCW